MFIDAAHTLKAFVVTWRKRKAKTERANVTAVSHIE